MFEPELVTVKTVIWDGEDHCEILSEAGTTWMGMKRKDFFDPDSDWEKRIIPGAKLRYWTVQAARVMGVELWNGVLWESVWVAGNDFLPKAEREKREKGYVEFIETEGRKIAKLIDEGKTICDIDKLISKEHTGNTYGWALNLGIRDAKNRSAAERIRTAHNKKYGVSEEKKVVVNPAIMSVGVKK